jgi:hypothetical protein
MALGYLKMTSFPYTRIVLPLYSLALAHAFFLELGLG